MIDKRERTLRMMNFNMPGPGKSYSLHNHSCFSDGAGTLEEITAAGKAAGVQVLGLSDHWVVPPYEGTDYQTWAMPHDKLDEYVDTLLKLKKEYEDDNFSLKIGLEVDFFFENIREVIANLQKYPLDYLIGSVHYSGVFSVDYDISQWTPLSEEEKNHICNIYWEKLEGAAQSGFFSFIGHLDLPKKFGVIDNSRYFPQAMKVLDAVQQNHGAIELNTSGWFKQCAEQYPALEILQAACQRNIPILVNADAHCAEHLQRNFDQAYAILQQAGYKFN